MKAWRPGGLKALDPVPGAQGSGDLGSWLLFPAGTETGRCNQYRLLRQLETGDW